MTRIPMTAILATFAIALTACEPGACEGPECDSGTTTDPGEVKYGEMEILPSIDGVHEDCTYQWNGKRYFTEDGPLRVPVGTHDVFVGNPDLEKDDGEQDLTIDGSLKHISADGREWFADVVSPEVHEDKNTPVEVPLNRYFEGNWACSRDLYVYDADAPDLKGELAFSFDDPVQHIYVKDDHKVYPDNDINGGWSDSLDHLEVDGNHLSLVVGSGNTTYITSEEIGDDFLAITTISETGSQVVDLLCERQ